MQALQNMYEYLLDSESQMGEDKVGDNVVQNTTMEDGHSVPVAAGAGDTNICGGITQLYWNKILERCLDCDEEVRQTALKVRIELLNTLYSMLKGTKVVHLAFTLPLFGN